MARRFKRKTLFLLGLVGVGILSLFQSALGGRNNEKNALSYRDLKGLLSPKEALADVPYSQGYYQGYYQPYYQGYYQGYYQPYYQGYYQGYYQDYYQPYYQGYYQGYYQDYYQGYYQGYYQDYYQGDYPGPDGCPADPGPCGP